MYRVIFLGLISMVCGQTYPAYDEAYTKLIFNMAASAYPVYNITPNPINACLNKSFPNATWDVKQTYTLQCGYQNDNDECQVFIAVSSQINTTVIAFRGTIGASQFLDELKRGYTMSITADNVTRVNSYFYQSMLTMWGSGVSQYISSHPTYKIIITGHSLGGALASLTAYQIRNTMPSITPDQIQLITFGEPRTGDIFYSKFLRNNINYIFRVVHGSDPIPHLPFCAPNSAGGCKTDSTNDYYQHPQEIWYHSASTNNYNMGTTFQACSKTDGEDSSCSDSISDLCFVFQNGGVVHTHYFDVDIGTFGANSCDYSIAKSYFVHPQEASLQQACGNSAAIITLNFTSIIIALTVLYFKSIHNKL